MWGYMHMHVHSGAGEIPLEDFPILCILTISNRFISRAGGPSLPPSTKAGHSQQVCCYSPS